MITKSLKLDNLYEDLAPVYHLFFRDWEQSMAQESAVLAKLLPTPKNMGPILDCACGIGTQTIPLAKLGYQVEGIDLSPAMIERAKHEATKRSLLIDYRVDDMRELKTAQQKKYDAIITMDNSIPHLNNNEEIVKALTAMTKILNNGGLLLLSLRDYDNLLLEKPDITKPAFCLDGMQQRIIHQVWHWIDERRYIVHFYITVEIDGSWKSYHSAGLYRAITPNELAELTIQAGFNNVEVLNAKDTGYYQPIVRGYNA